MLLMLRGDLPVCGQRCTCSQLLTARPGHTLPSTGRPAVLPAARCSPSRSPSSGTCSGQWGLSRRDDVTSKQKPAEPQQRGIPGRALLPVASDRETGHRCPVSILSCLSLLNGPVCCRPPASSGEDRSRDAASEAQRLADCLWGTRRAHSLTPSRALTALAEKHPPPTRILR